MGKFPPSLVHLTRRGYQSAPPACVSGQTRGGAHLVLGMLPCCPVPCRLTAGSLCALGARCPQKVPTRGSMRAHSKRNSNSLTPHWNSAQKLPPGHARWVLQRLVHNPAPWARRRLFAPTLLTLTPLSQRNSNSLYLQAISRIY